MRAAGPEHDDAMRPARAGARAALLLLALAAAPDARAGFVEVAAARGLVHLQHDPNPFGECLLVRGLLCEPERMTGGAAVADVDRDGDLDLVATRLDAPPILFCNQLAQTGHAQFADCSANAGLDALPAGSNGAAFGDVDNDGDADLYVTSIATLRFHLFVNDGTGRFEEQALARGAAIASSLPHAGYGVEFGDFDRDGWLDLHVNEWRPQLADLVGTRHTRLLRNRGAVQPGHFDDVTAAAGVTLPGSHEWAFASALRDLDGDGWLDLAVAADFGTSRLFWNQRDGTFADGTAAAGVGTDENGMGSTLGDADGDGDLDWFVTSIFDPAAICADPPPGEACNWGTSGNRLYRNEGGRVFADATGDAVTGVRDGGWGWGAALFDYDLDGDLDLAMTNGIDFPDLETEAPFADDPLRLWRNDGAGAWTEVAASEGFVDDRSGKGLLVFDYDADGDLDVFVANNGAAPALFENQAVQPGGPHWLRVRVVGRHSNRDALGAIVRVRPVGAAAAQTRVVGSTSHFLAWSDPAAHFGLGATAQPHVVSVWFPASGARWGGRVEADALDRTIVVRETARPPVCGLLGIEAAAAAAIARVARRWRSGLRRGDAPPGLG